MDVLMDLWGVLTDSRRMKPAYREGMAGLLSGRHGGSADAWARAHDVALAWYEDHLSRPETWTRGSWRETVDRAEAENLVRMFREVGVAPPEDPLAVAKAIELEVMSHIDAAFPDARSAVSRLKAAGHRVSVSTNATESNARGSLLGARLLHAFDYVFTGELLNAGKVDSGYWNAIKERLGTDVSRAVVVDDRLEYLGPAASCGFLVLLLDRDGRHGADTVPSYVRAVLRGLAGLPHYMGLVVKETNL